MQSSVILTHQARHKKYDLQLKKHIHKNKTKKDFLILWNISFILLA